jgi:hypothetical protein
MMARRVFRHNRFLAHRRCTVASKPFLSSVGSTVITGGLPNVGIPKVARTAARTPRTFPAEHLRGR